MKVTIQHYNKDPKKTSDQAAKIVTDHGLSVESAGPDKQTVEVANEAAAKSLIKELMPLVNVQLQTEA